MNRLFAFFTVTLSIIGVASAEWLPEATVRAAAEAFPATDAIGSSVLNGRTVSGLSPRGRLWIVALEPSGHIVMSGSDLANPIVGFSKNDFAEPDPKSPAFAVLEGASASVEALESKGGTRHARWDALLGAGTRGVIRRSASTPEPGAVIIEPFLDTHYDQCQPYNDYSPVHSAIPGEENANRGRAPCGCVATAAAQMLKHFRWPARIDQTLSFGHVFTDANKENHTYTIRFDGHEPIDWDSIGTEYELSVMDLRGNVAESERYPIARLVHFCDVLAQMEFSPGGSGASHDILARNLLDWYTDGSEIDVAKAEDYSLAVADLQAHIPLQVEIFYEGYGHQVVAHGWADDGDNKYIYLNFGWSGDDDAYYNLNGEGKVTLRKIHVGIHPRLMAQFDPLPKVSSEQVQLNWHIPEYWAGSDELTECSMVAYAYDTSATDKMSDDFSSDKGVSTSGRISRGAKTGTLDIYKLAWGAYEWNDLQLLTARSVLSFAIDSKYASGHELTVEASFDGGEWTVVSTPLLNLASGSSGWRSYRVFLGDHGGEMARFRVRVSNNGSYYDVDFPIISVDDFCVTETCRQTEGERKNVELAESGPIDFDGLTPGARYAFTMELTTKDGVVKSCPVFTTVAGEYTTPLPGEQSIDTQDLVYSAAAGDSAWSINGTNPTDTSIKTDNRKGGFTCSINVSLTENSVLSFGWTANGFYGYYEGVSSYDSLVGRFTAEDGTETTLFNIKNEAEVSSEQRISMPLSSFAGQSGVISVEYIHNGAQYVGDTFGMTFNNPKVTKVSVLVLPEASFSVDTLEAGTIPEITSVSHTTSEVVDGLFSECSMGGNVFEVTCSPSVVSLEAHASAATLIPDSAIKVTGLGAGRFIVEVDGGGIPEYAERTRAILTLAATDANGSTSYRDLSLRFSTETEPDVYVPVEPGEYAVSVGDKGDIEETAVEYVVTAKDGVTLTAADFDFGSVSKEAYDIVIAPDGKSATVTLKTPVFGVAYVEAEAEKDPDDPSGFLVVVDESLLDDIPDHAEYEAVSALPVKAFPGLCYQAGWGSSLDKLTYGRKVRAEKSTLYLGVIRQTGSSAFYKLTVSDRDK